MNNFLVWSKDGSNSIVQQSIQYSDNHSGKKKKESQCGKCDGAIPLSNRRGESITKDSYVVYYG